MAQEPITVRVKRAYPSFVAGLAYEGPGGIDRRAYFSRLPIGARLMLEPEPDNEFDPDAIALRHVGNHVGYIPRKHDWIARALSEGDHLICVVESIHRDEADYDHVFRVGLTVGIVADGDVTPIAIHETPEARAIRERATLEDNARRCCVDGLRVLAYLTLTDGVRSPEETNIEISAIESRLAMAGIYSDPELMEMLIGLVAELKPTKNALTRSANILSKDEAYFRLIYESALLVAEFDGATDKLEAVALDRLRKGGKLNGWLS